MQCVSQSYRNGRNVTQRTNCFTNIFCYMLICFIYTTSFSLIIEKKVLSFYLFLVHKSLMLLLMCKFKKKSKLHNFQNYTYAKINVVEFHRVSFKSK